MPEAQIHLNSAILFSIIGVLICAVIGGAWGTLWRIISRMEKKVDSLSIVCGGRMVGCLKEFVTVKAFEDWKEGRGPLWNSINFHHHDPTGGVVREKIK